MTPNCCKNCAQLLNGGSCMKYKQCQKWRLWFRREWNAMKESMMGRTVKLNEQRETG